MFTCVFQAGRLLLNESDFSALQNNFLPYKTWGVNRLDLIEFSQLIWQRKLESPKRGSTCVFRLVSFDLVFRLGSFGAAFAQRFPTFFLA